MRCRLVVLATALACLATTAAATEPFTVLTMQPYLANEVNGLELNHLFLQSLFALDSTPITVGAGIRSAPASYLRTDGKTTDAGLGKALYVVSLGLGHPKTGLAGFAGLNLSNVRPSGFPNVLTQSGDKNSFIAAAGTSSVFFAGAAYHGWAVELAQYATSQTYDADGFGRFVAGGCDPEFGCGAREVRSGAPVPASPKITKIQRQSLVVNAEYMKGYSAAIIVTPKQKDVETTGLTGVRILAQPGELAALGLGALGAGINSYDRSVDYYGDRIHALNQAVKQGTDLPGLPKSRLYEVPLVSDNIAETGVNARLTMQVAPKPLFRSAEVGYAYQTGTGHVLPQVGGRAKLFRRDTGYVPSVDTYAGVFWLFEKDKPDDDDKGVSIYASYSYNSPDSMTFIPLADTHVIGLQVTYGNPLALPPPVPIFEYPAIAPRSEAHDASTTADAAPAEPAPAETAPSGDDE